MDRNTFLVEMTLQNNNKEEVLREEAVNAAQKLFRQYGFHKTTMEDIAKAMGRGKSTLYYYYKSKEEVFDAVLTKEIEEVFRKTRQAIDKVSLAEEKLKIYFSVSFKAVKSKVNLYKVVRGELTDGASFVNNLARKFNTIQVQSVRNILEQGIKNEEFTALLADDVDLASYSIVSALRSLALDLAIEEKFPNWDERLNALMVLLIKGLRK